VSHRNFSTGPAGSAANFAPAIRRAVWALLLIGCGARTELEGGGVPGPSPSDAGRDAFIPLVDGGPPPPPRDGGVDAGRDAGIDAGRDAGPDSGTMAGSCRRDADCGELRCRRDTRRAPADLAPVPLVCGALDDAASDGEFCDTASDCDRGLCVLAGTCVPPCVSDADCAMGYACRPVYALTSLSAAQPMNGCVQPLVLHDAVRSESLPATTIAGSGSLTPPPVPSAPTLHVFRASDPNVAMQTERLLTADGRTLFDIGTVFPGNMPPANPVAGFGSVFSLLTPNGSRPVSGALTVEVAVFPSRAVVSGTRILGSAGAGRVLDVDLFYVGGGMLRPEADGSVSPRVMRALREAERTLAPARIRFGEIRQHVIPGILRGRLAIVDSGLEGTPGELQELFALAAGAGRGSLPIFLVRDISGALGIAGDIPGAWMHPGEITNGIAISVDSLFDPDPLTPPFGRVIAHETGHFLGLFHTSELDGTVLDPIDDTPICGPDRDTDGDGFLLAAECMGAGGDHMMFWAAQGDVVSRGQAAVLGSALVLR
jgi:hypothetical protein